MKPIDLATIEAAFSKKQLQKVGLPDVQVIDWPEQDFLAWFDKDGHRAGFYYQGQTGVIATVMERRRVKPTRPTAYICAWCDSPQAASGIASFATVPASKPETVISLYLCADLECSLFARQLKRPSGVLYGDTSSVERRVERLQGKLVKFALQVS